MHQTALGCFACASGAVCRGVKRRRRRLLGARAGREPGERRSGRAEQVVEGGEDARRPDDGARDIRRAEPFDEALVRDAVARGVVARRRVHADVDEAFAAGRIFVMEPKHKSRLVAAFRDAIAHRTIHVLDIPDVYGYMDDELVEHLRTSVAAILDL